MDGWCLLGGSAATGIAANGDRHVACAGGSRQAAMTSTTRAGEPTAVSIPQGAVIMGIGLSFRFESDKFSISMAPTRLPFQRGFAQGADT